MNSQSKPKNTNTMKQPSSVLRSFTAFVCILGFVNASFGAEPSGVTAAEALHRLELGNARFVSGHVTSMTPEEIDASRAKVAQSQHPFAIIVGCADSRVGPEVIFDQKVGDIFVVRSAGEVVDPVGIGSIEYAVAHLGSPLIVVLGHERCGAVAAAVAGAKEPGHIAAVLKAIEPAVRETKGEPGDPVHNAVVAQALNVASQLQNSEPILKEAIQSGKLAIVAALYNLDTGKVSLLSAAAR
jgi:carbonic anhydrase